MSHLVYDTLDPLWTVVTDNWAASHKFIRFDLINLKNTKIAIQIAFD